MIFKKELMKGIEQYYGAQFRNVEEAKFFLQHGHQVAYDEGKYDEFMKAFPHFFKYSFSDKDIEELFG